VKRMLSAVVLALGLLMAATGLLWWYLFYGAAVAQMEYATYSDVFVCLYRTTEQCRLANESIAFLAGATPYTPLLFQSGVGILTAGLVLRLLGKVRRT